MKNITRVALITSGGDCQGLNAAMRGIGKALHNKIENLEIFGMYDGYRGLIEGDYKFMEPKDFAGILTQGGTILGTSRQRYVPGKDIVDENGNSLIPAMKDTYNKLNLDCLVIMGGNGTQKSAKLLMDAGMNVVTLPKTIDNDIWGTDTTFGFQSAVDIATNVIDYIHSTASSHSRVFLVELMGRDAGWLTLHAGIGSGADIILIPEIPYDIDNILKAIDHRRRHGRSFSILAVAEGANMPSTPEAIAIFQKAQILYAPGKAANAGGVAVSGLEMTQNSERLRWSSEEVDAKLHSIMNDIHANCVKYGTQEDGYVNYVKGANVAGFLKVAKAMMAQGIV